MTLNFSSLKQKVSELGLRQWWIAEQVGVSKMTVMRWLNGKVRRVRRDNVERLARCIGCATSELIASSDCEIYGTTEDLKYAATLITDQETFELYRRDGKWALFDALARAVMSPRLPLWTLGDLYFRLAQSRANQYRYEEALGLLMQTASIAERLGDPNLSCRTLGLHGVVLFHMHRLREAGEFFERALRLSADVDMDLVMRLKGNYAGFLITAGRYKAADVLLQEILACRKVEFPPHVKAGLLRYRSRALRMLGETCEGLVLAHQALDISRQCGDHLGEFRAMRARTRLFMDEGRVAEAREALEFLEASCEQVGEPSVRLRTLRARLLILEGKPDEAVALLERERTRTDDEPGFSVEEYLQVMAEAAHAAGMKDVCQKALTGVAQYYRARRMRRRLSDLFRSYEEYRGIV